MCAQYYVKTQAGIFSCLLPDAGGPMKLLPCSPAGSAHASEVIAEY